MRESQLGDADRVVLRSSRGPVIWIALALLVVAVGAVVYLGVRGGSAGDLGAGDAVAVHDAAPTGPPAPFLIDRMRVVVDQPYEADQIRVLSVKKRDPEQVAEVVRTSREQFLSLLTERGISEGVGVTYVNVVVVPEALICDRRLYESDPSYQGCEKRESHYRAHERTLYVADNERLLTVNLPSGVALQMCLDAGNAECAGVFQEFERGLLAGGKKPKKKRRR